MNWGEKKTQKRRFNSRLNEVDEGPVSSKTEQWNSPNQSSNKKNEEECR